MSIKSKLKQNRIIFVIILTALILRLWGVWHGFPFFYHPDEPTVINETLALPNNQFNPGHFDWPHFHYYVSAAFFLPVALLQLLMSGGDTSVIRDNLIIYYSLGRLLSVFMGTASVFLVYKISKKMFSEKVAILSATILALNVVHVSESQVATLDVPMTFWLLLSTYFAVLILKQPSRFNYSISGFLLGVAISTKYNAGMGVLFILTAHLLNNLHVQFPHTIHEISIFLKSFTTGLKNTKLVLLSLISLIFGFLVGTPYSILNYKTFLSTSGPEGALWQFIHVGSGGYTQGILERYSYLLFSVFSSAFGLLLVIAAIYGLYRVIKKRDHKALFFAPFTILYTVYLGSFSYSPEHFFVPLYPFLAIFASIGTWLLLDKTISFFAAPRSKTGFVTKVFILIFLSFPFIKTVYNDIVLTRKDTRTLAYEWINENIPAGSGIVIGDDYEPHLDDTKYDLHSIYEILLNDDLSGPIYPKFNDKGIRFGVLGGFDLQERFDQAKWDKKEPRYPDYLLDDAGVIKRFDPIGRPGPIVMIFEIGYDYEVHKIHKETDLDLRK